MAEVSTTTPGLSINDPSEKAVRTRSRFPQLSYPFYNTHRFGEYSPFFVMEGVEGDKIPVRSSHEVRSYSMKAPLMQNIRRNKDFYEVPMEAILPINWEKFYTNPVIGDDVDDNVGTGVQSFWNKVRGICTKSLSDLRTLIDSWLDSLEDDTKEVRADAPSESDILTYIFRWLVLCEYFYSDGHLISSLGSHSSYKCRISVDSNDLSAGYQDFANVDCFDQFFDYFCGHLSNVCDYFVATIDGLNKYVIVRPDSSSVVNLGTTSPAISFRDFLEYLRDDLNVSVYSVHWSDSGVRADGDEVPQSFLDLVDCLFSATITTIEFSSSTETYNLARLWAYQLCVSHFYSNDHVDFIYSADLLRSLIQYDVVNALSATETPLYFTYNGIKYMYDAMSAKYFEEIASEILTNGGLLDSADLSRVCMRGYFGSLFAYRRSLRFVDYFTGSRTRPLAIGNVDVNVTLNKVNVIDVTQNIQKQRFLNAVNRFGRKFREYINGLSGVTPSVDYHNPLYLGHTADSIYGVETENTGVGQLTEANSITSRLQSNGARYQFEVSCDRPCVIIGISYYDIQRVYITTTERQLMHLNRFDMFNPFMQFIGDQPVFIGELGSKRFFSANWNFSYQLRHMEYKQRYPQGAGGFVRNLPGFIFTNKADDDRALQAPVLSEDFIRSLNSELDPYYVSLTGFSLGSYFHFIVCDHNDCDASRPMAYAPTIL